MSRGRLARLIGEVAAPWAAAEEDRLLARREHERLRAAGAGPDHGLPFTDRVIVTLVYLRFQLPHAALAELYEVHRSTVTRAVGEVRPLLAARGFAVPGEPGVRLRTLADVFAYAAARGVTLRLDGTEVQVRRPRAGKPGRRAFVSGKKKMNTKKAAVITDEKGRTLWAGAFRPGRMHDQTAVRTEGIADLFTRHPQVRAKVDAGDPRPGQRVPGPGPGTAAETEEGRRPGRNRRLRGTAAPAVIRTDLRRARQRGAQAMAHPPAVPRTPRRLRRDLPGRRRPGLRPRRRAVTTRQPARRARPSANRAPRRYRLDEAGNPLRAQKARNSRSGSASRRPRSARRPGSTAAVSRSPARRARASSSTSAAKRSMTAATRARPGGDDGPVRPVGGRAQVDRLRVAALAGLPEPARAPPQPARLVRQAAGEVIAAVQVSVLIAAGVSGAGQPAARSSPSASSSASRPAAATSWCTREGDSPAAAARVRIEIPSARAETSAHVRSRSAWSSRHAARETRASFCGREPPAGREVEPSSSPGRMACHPLPGTGACDPAALCGLLAGRGPGRCQGCQGLVQGAGQRYLAVQPGQAEQLPYLRPGTGNVQAGAVRGGALGRAD